MILKQNSSNTKIISEYDALQIKYLPAKKYYLEGFS